MRRVEGNLAIVKGRVTEVHNREGVSDRGRRGIVLRESHSLGGNGRVCLKISVDPPINRNLRLELVTYRPYSNLRE